MELTGSQFIGQNKSQGAGSVIEAINPATGKVLLPLYNSSTLEDVATACSKANVSFVEYRNTSIELRCAFLEAIAVEIEGIGEALILRAMAETGLPKARLEGERGRTCGQLRHFIDILRSGESLGLRVDSALPDRQPMPRPDLRQQHIAIGPVAVFGASNFPLAFSVAGGDTASALAAGCPVVVKAHSAHLGTSEYVAAAIQRAVKKCAMPEGVFSLLYDDSIEISQALVGNEFIQAVGFTGSRQGGLALQNIAQARAIPIPVYAEMSSVNPVFLLSNALNNRSTELAQGFVSSLSMGAGQFCTNPGLVIAQRSEHLNQFLEEAQALVSSTSAQTMLSPHIHSTYLDATKKVEEHESVEHLARGKVDNLPYQCQAQLFKTSATHYLERKELQVEVFGATSIIVECEDEKEMINVAAQLEGQLTATLQFDNGDLPSAKSLLPVLEQKAGRILVNGWPTGVEVAHSMVHGGPFPATSNTQTTSVGSGAINRFLRPVCYQNFPSDLLPSELRNENIARITRLENGKRVMNM